MRNILERREYTGCIVNFKTYRNSIWDKKKRNNPVENHSIFYDTHEAIIPEDIFEKVQVLRQNRQRRSKTGKTSLFSGLVHCSDCGEKLYYCTANNFKKRQDFFEFSTRRKNDEKCKSDVVELQRNIEAQKQQNERLEKFIQKAKHYQDLDSLTPDALRDMVSAIYVSAPDQSSSKRQQKIEIYYDGSGFIPLNLLMQRETA